MIILDSKDPIVTTVRKAFQMTEMMRGVINENARLKLHVIVKKTEYGSIQEDAAIYFINELYNETICST